MLYKKKNNCPPVIRNSLTVDQCLKNKKMINTPACKLPTELCIKFPEFAPMIACQGNEYPAAVCGSSLVFARLNGCAGVTLPVEACASSAEFALLEGCKGSQLTDASRCILCTNYVHI